MKRRNSLIIITVVLTLTMFAAGCSGGEATGGGGFINPTATPTQQVPTPTGTQPSATPTTIPSGVAIVTGKTDFANASFSLVKMPVNDFFNYKIVQDGVDKLYTADLPTKDLIADPYGDFETELAQGKYSVFQNISSTDKITGSAINEKYFIGQFSCEGGKNNTFNIENVDFVTLSIKIRFQYPTSFLDFNEYMRVVGYLSNTGKISTIPFDFRDNLEIKQWQITGKFPKKSYIFTSKAFNKNAMEYDINTSSTWDMSYYSGIIEKKLLIGTISPGGDPTTYEFSDPNILIGGNTVENSGYRVVQTNSAGELILASYNNSVSTELKNQIAILTNFNSGSYYVAYFPVKNFNDSSANTKILSLSMRQREGDGQLSWYNVLGSDFDSYSSPDKVVPVLFTGKTYIGFKADAYPSMVNYGVGKVTINTVGNFNTTEVYNFPGE